MVSFYQINNVIYNRSPKGNIVRYHGSIDSVSNVCVVEVSMKMVQSKPTEIYLIEGRPHCKNKQGGIVICRELVGSIEAIRRQKNVESAKKHRLMKKNAQERKVGCVETSCESWSVLASPSYLQSIPTFCYGPGGGTEWNDGGVQGPGGRLLVLDEAASTAENAAEPLCLGPAGGLAAVSIHGWCGVVCGDVGGGPMEAAKTYFGPGDCSEMDGPGVFLYPLPPPPAAALNCPPCPPPQRMLWQPTLPSPLMLSPSAAVASSPPPLFADSGVGGTHGRPATFAGVLGLAAHHGAGPAGETAPPCEVVYPVIAPVYGDPGAGVAAAAAGSSPGGGGRRRHRLGQETADTATRSKKPKPAAATLARRDACAPPPPLAPSAPAEPMSLASSSASLALPLGSLLATREDEGSAVSPMLEGPSVSAFWPSVAETASLAPWSDSLSSSAWPSPCWADSLASPFSASLAPTSPSLSHPAAWVTWGLAGDLDPFPDHGAAVGGDGEWGGDASW